VLKGRTWLLAAAALLGVIVAITFRDEPAQPSHEARSEPQHEQGVPGAATPAVDAPTEHSQTTAVPQASAGSVDHLNEDAVAFRVNANGELVIDERTRLNMEAMIAQNDSEHLLDEAQEQTKHLPAVAARQAEELVQTFVQYQQAQRQMYPPRETPITEDDAIRELEGLRALRETHFGADVAHRLYGEEEAIAREMIEVMRVENDASLTTDEKLARARALRERLPGVAAIEKANREAAASSGDEEK